MLAEVYFVFVVLPSRVKVSVCDDVPEEAILIFANPILCDKLRPNVLPDTVPLAICRSLALKLAWVLWSVFTVQPDFTSPKNGFGSAVYKAGKEFGVATG